MKTQVISIVNNKGGVGKTLSTYVMAEILAFLGHKVLVVDLDESANLSMLLHNLTIDSEAVERGIELSARENIHEVFKYRYKTLEDMTRVVYKTNIANVDVIPASKRHKNTPVSISSNRTGNNNIILKRALSAIKNNYDYILIDNSPHEDILTVNSMFASDWVIVPVRSEKLSLKGLREILDSILYIKEEHDLDNLNLLGTFIVQAEINTKAYKLSRNEYLEAKFPEGRFLDAPIRKDTHINELATNYVPLLKSNPNTNAIFDYSKLILEAGILNNEFANKLKSCIGM